MARGRKKPNLVNLDSEGEDGEAAKPSKPLIVLTSASDEEDDEANEDLSLKIVQKAVLRACGTTRKHGGLAESKKKTDVIDLTEMSSHEDEPAVVLKKKKKRKKKGILTPQQAVDVTNEGEKAETSKAVEFDTSTKGNHVLISDYTVIPKLLVDVANEEEKAETSKAETSKTETSKVETSTAVEFDASMEGNPVEVSDNTVLRKLLRGPRYFDPPDSGWGTCYNCGEEGHTSVNCTSLRRKKPCFVCGSLDHFGKQCAKGQGCFICKKGGHRAKDCPEKYLAGSQNYRICLRCGGSGHEMFMCKNDYSHADLKEIQCYVCKSFGHLCCTNVSNTGPREISCYRCGQLGHSGLGCTGARGEMPGTPRARGEMPGTPSSCYKCGEEGHFARECSSSAKGCAGSREEINGTPRSCYKCGEGGHLARECPSSYKLSVSASAEKTGILVSCYNCGVEGHFARACTNSAKPSISASADRPGTPKTCYNCGDKGHFARDCADSAKAHKRNRDLQGARSAPHDLGKASKRRKPQYEGEFSTPSKSKQRGGWITEDPGDLARRNPKSSGWTSPATPSNKKIRMPAFNNSGYSSSSRFQPSQNLHYGIPALYGSANIYQPRFSTPMFGEYSSDGMWRNYHW